MGRLGEFRGRAAEGANGKTRLRRRIAILNIYLSVQAGFVAEATWSFAPAGDFAITPLTLYAARALVTERSTKTGKRDRQASRDMADFCDPFFWERPWRIPIEL